VRLEVDFSRSSAVAVGARSLRSGERAAHGRNVPPKYFPTASCPSNISLQPAPLAFTLRGNGSCTSLAPRRPLGQMCSTLEAMG
jgi:hypothetical protein